MASFNLEELHALCFDLGLDFEMLASDTLSGKARELVITLDRKRRLGDLIDLCAKERPHLNWRQMLAGSAAPQPDQQPAAWEAASQVQPAAVPPVASLLREQTNPSPVLELRVSLSPDRKTLSYVLHSPNGVDYNSRPVGQVELASDPLKVLQPTFDKLSTLARQSAATCTADETTRMIREIEAIGHNLYDDLFPPELKAEYRRIREAYGGQSLLIVSDESWIPWEMVQPHEAGRDNLIYDDPPLCQMFRLSRWLPGRGAPAALSVDNIALIAPVDNLAAVAPEIGYFTDLKSRYPKLGLAGPITTLNEVEAGFRSGDTRVFHFACHGNVNAEDPNEPKLKLADDFLRPSQIVGASGAGLRRAKPMVFLNTASGGRIGFGLTQHGGWAQRFLDAGASAFISPLWEINDSLAAIFVKEFYNRLWGLAGHEAMPLGQAFYEARMAIRALDPANPTWLAYVLYGDPNAWIRLAPMPVEAEAKAAAPSAGAGVAAGEALKDWTILIYLAADCGRTFDTQRGKIKLMSELAPAMHRQLNGLEGAAQSDRIAVLAQMDELDVGCRRMQVRPGQPQDTWPAETLGQVNTGDPDVLRDFLAWGLRLRPARHTLLVLGGHGGWMRGDPYATVRGDVTSGSAERDGSAAGGQLSLLFDDAAMDALDLLGLEQTLREASQETGRDIDVLGLDADLAAGIEAAYQLRSVADYMVAPEDVEPAEGWPLAAIVDQLAGAPEMLPLDLATAIVKAYESAGDRKDVRTLSAVYLIELNGLGESASAFVAAAQQDPPTLAALRAATENCAATVDRDRVDLADLLDQFLASLEPAAAQGSVSLAATALRTALEPGAGAVTANLARGDKIRGRMHGLSVYFPSQRRPSAPIDASDLEFAKTGWYDLVRRVLEGTEEPSAGPGPEQPAPEAGPQESPAPRAAPAPQARDTSLQWFVNRNAELVVFQSMLAGSTPQRVLVFSGPGGVGKTSLLRRLHDQCRSDGVPACFVNFSDRRAWDYLAIVREVRDQLGPVGFNPLTEAINASTQGSQEQDINTAISSHPDVAGQVEAGDVSGQVIIRDNSFFIRADSEGARRQIEARITGAFFTCLEALQREQEIVLLFDSYEQVTAEADRWLLSFLLARVLDDRLPRVIIVIAGRQVPVFPAEARGMVAERSLGPLSEQDVRDYMRKRAAEGLDVSAVYAASAGNPGMLARMIDTAAAQIRPARVWLYMAAGDDPAQLDLLARKEQVRWGANPNTRAGDLVLMYRTAPLSDIAYFFRAASDARPAERTATWQWDYAIDLADKITLARPVTFQELQAQPDLVGWGLVKAHMQGALRRTQDICAEGFWGPLRSLLITWNPACIAALAGWENLTIEDLLLSLSSDAARGQVIAALAPTLTPEQLDQFLLVARAVQDPASRQEALEAIGEAQAALQPDFSEIIETAAQGFTGREEILAEIDRWLADAQGPRYLVVSGEPGSGKTALAARLVRDGKTTAYHFCLQGRTETVDPRAFLRLIILQLVNSLPGFGPALLQGEGPTIDVKQDVAVLAPGGKLVGIMIGNLDLDAPLPRLKITQNVGSVSEGGAVKSMEVHNVLLPDLPPSEMFRRFIAEPLGRGAVSFGSVAVILVDGLDVALAAPGENILDLVAGTGDLPPQLRFIVTTRPDPRVMTRFVPGSVAQLKLEPGRLTAEIEPPPMTEILYDIQLDLPAEPVRVGEEFPVIVSLLPGGTGQGNFHELTLSAQEARGGDLSIELDSATVQVVGNNMTSLPLDPQALEDRVVPRARLAGRAARPGDVEVKLTFRPAAQPAVVLAGVVQVAGFVEQIEPVVVRSRPIPQPDLVLEVSSRWAANNASFTYRYRLRSYRSGLAAADGVEGESKELPEGWVDKIRSQLALALERGAGAGSDVATALASLGAQLYQAVVPPEVRSALRDVVRRHPDGQLPLLIVPDRDAWLPWGLLYDGQAFLAERFVIGQWPRELDDLRAYEFPIGQTSIAYYEGGVTPEAWVNLLQTTGAPAPQPLPGGVFDLAEITEVRGLHIIRRGQAPGAASRADLPVRLGSAGGRARLEEEVSSARLNLRRGRPLVTLSYLNAGQPELTMLEETWGRAYTGAGCSAFVGPLWAVDPDVDATFASTFYATLWRGASLGAALQTAQRLARTGHPASADWLAYTLLGDPMARPYRPVKGNGYAVVEPVGRRFEEPVPAGGQARFRVMLSRKPPLWHNDRVIEVAEELAFDPLQIHVIAPGLQSSPPSPIAMFRTAEGGYQGWFTVAAPPVINAAKTPVQVFFLHGSEPIDSLMFLIDLRNSEEAQP